MSFIHIYHRELLLTLVLLVLVVQIWTLLSLGSAVGALLYPRRLKHSRAAWLRHYLAALLTHRDHTLARYQATLNTHRRHP